MNSQDFRSLSEAYLDVYENEQLDEMPYRVVTKNNDGEEVYVGGKYSTRKTARTKVDKEDEKVGGYRHSIRKVDEATAMSKRGLDEPAIRNQIASQTRGGKSADRATALADKETYGNKEMKAGRENLARKQRGTFRDTTSSSPGLRGYGHQSSDPAVKAKQDARGNQRARAALTPNERKQLNMESYDLFDYMMEYLITEGYADTNENALVIMANMSEEWREDILDEGIGSAIRGLFGKKKEPEVPAPQSRGAELRAKYNTGPEKTETSVKRKILDKTRERAEKDEKEYGDSTYSKSVATKSREAHNKYLRAGYNKYGADRSDSGGMGGSGGSGSGNKARKRAAALNNSYDLFDYMMEYLIDEGYADTNENALVIMANMSEDWRESIMEISQKTATRAFAKRATNEFESDSDNPTDFTKSGKSKADETKRRVDRKFGKKAGEHAERAAHAGIFGRKSFSMPKKPN